MNALPDTAIAVSTEKTSRIRRTTLLKWLRKTHLYLGLWGALLGLLFGLTGFLMNHRAVLKIPVEKTIQRTVQLTLPSQPFDTPEQMAAWLQQEIRFPAPGSVQIRTQPARKIIWADQEVTQPPRWMINWQTPQRSISAEYFVGNRFIKLDQTDATPIGYLTRLHTATGANAFWVLLSDTIAGSLMLLSITGLLLWTQLHTIRTLAVFVSITALLTATLLLW